MSELEEAAVRDRPDVRAARARAQAAGHEESAAWWSLLGPDVVGEVRQTWAGDALGNLQEGRLDAGALLRWTFRWDEGGRITETAARRRAADVQLRAVEDRIRAAHAEGRLALRAAAERIPLAQQGLEAAQRSLRVSAARYQAGTALAIEVLESEDSVARARLALAGAIVDFNRAQLGLLAAAGRVSRESFRGWAGSAPSP